MSNVTGNCWQKRDKCKFFVFLQHKTTIGCLLFHVFNKKEVIVRSYFLPLILSFVLVLGLNCVKGDTCSPKTVLSEAPQMQSFATAYGINATAHSSGLYYEVIDPGSGATPSLSSKIAITYTGMLLNGTVFDERLTPNNSTDPQAAASDRPWSLSDLIEGWRVGIPLIKEGGHIKLIIPSAMAYGCTGYGDIPANSILFFDITLVDVQ